MSTKPRYRLVTGPDDESFSQRICEYLDDGYILYGSPAIGHEGDQRIVAQAILLSNRDRNNDRGGFDGPRKPFRKFDDRGGPGGGGGDFGGGFNRGPGGGGGDRDRDRGDRPPFGRRPDRF
jgi:hypothetical protein